MPLRDRLRSIFKPEGHHRGGVHAEPERTSKSMEDVSKRQRQIPIQAVNMADVGRVSGNELTQGEAVKQTLQQVPKKDEKRLSVGKIREKVEKMVPHHLLHHHLWKEKENGKESVKERKGSQTVASPQVSVAPGSISADVPKQGAGSVGKEGYLLKREQEQEPFPPMPGFLGTAGEREMLRDWKEDSGRKEIPHVDRKTKLPPPPPPSPPPSSSQPYPASQFLGPLSIEPSTISPMMLPSPLGYPPIILAAPKEEEGISTVQGPRGGLEIERYEISIETLESERQRSTDEAKIVHIAMEENRELLLERQDFTPPMESSSIPAVTVIPQRDPELDLPLPVLDLPLPSAIPAAQSHHLPQPMEGVFAINMAPSRDRLFSAAPRTEQTARAGKEIHHKHSPPSSTSSPASTTSSFYSTTRKEEQQQELPPSHSLAAPLNTTAPAQPVAQDIPVTTYSFPVSRPPAPFVTDYVSTPPLFLEPFSRVCPILQSQHVDLSNTEDEESYFTIVPSDEITSEVRLSLSESEHPQHIFLPTLSEEYSPHHHHHLAQEQQQEEETSTLSPNVSPTLISSSPSYGVQHRFPPSLIYQESYFEETVLGPEPQIDVQDILRIPPSLRTVEDEMKVRKGFDLFTEEEGKEGDKEVKQQKQKEEDENGLARALADWGITLLDEELLGM